MIETQEIGVKCPACLKTVLVEVPVWKPSPVGGVRLDMRDLARQSCASLELSGLVVSEQTMFDALVDAFDGKHIAYLDPRFHGSAPAYRHTPDVEIGTRRICDDATFTQLGIPLAIPADAINVKPLK